MDSASPTKEGRLGHYCFVSKQSSGNKVSKEMSEICWKWMVEGYVVLASYIRWDLTLCFVVRMLRSVIPCLALAAQYIAWLVGADLRCKRARRGILDGVIMTDEHQSYMQRGNRLSTAINA
jgi:hypothetical protein